MVWPVLVSILFIGVLFVAVFPSQTYFSQRASAEEKSDVLAELEARNAELEEQIDQLNDLGYLELEARRQFGFVFPGQESYGIVTPPNEPVDLPSTWPFNQLEERVEQSDEDPDPAE
jgi:cell division protein FtsB